MKTGHVTNRFVDWLESNLSGRIINEVESHLKTCEDCREYFAKMKAVFEEKNVAAIPKLELQPYLATRVKTRANEKQHQASHKAQSWLRWAAVTVASTAAIYLGIFLGNGLTGDSSAASSDTDLYTAYYEQYHQATYGERWESLLENYDGETQ